MKLYGAVDLHSTNNVTVLIDEEDKSVYQKRLPNDLALIPKELSEAVKKIPNRERTCTGANRAQCFKKSSLPQSATAPQRVQRGEVAWRGAPSGALRPRTTLPTALRRWASVTARIRLWASAYHNASALTLLSPRPRAMALTHSAVAARCL